MKLGFLALFILPAVAFATSVEYVEVVKLKAREAQLDDTIYQIRALYHEDGEFLSAFEAAQKQWEKYCAAALEARFPAKNKQEAYGSAFPIAYAVVKQGLVEARIAELAIWTTGVEEGDVSKGSVKWKAEIHELRKPKKG